MITDYGFNFSGVRDISVNRDNPIELSRIFSSIFYTKVFLFIISFVFLVGSILIFEMFSKNSTLILTLSLYMLGNIFYCQWFYQGLEKTQALPLINFFPRAVGVILIFTLLKTFSDLLIYALIISCVNLVVSIIAFIYAFQLTDLRLLRLKLNEIFIQLKNGWKLFISNIAINFYTTTNVFILGLITNETSVGIYSAADKIRYAIQGLFAPVSQSVFPRVNYLISQPASQFIRFNEKLLKLFSSITFIISLFVFILSELIVNIVLGHQYENSVNVLRILCWLPFVISISNVYGIQILLSLKQDKKFLQVVTSAALLSIILATVLTKLFNEIGTAFTFLMIEIYVSSFMYILFKRLFKKYEM